MINIPHQRPIRFVEKIIELNGDTALVACSFPSTPTLAMICEAAAQSSGAFSKETKIGYLLSLKECEILQEPTKLDYVLKTTKILEFDDMYEFSFELYDKNPIARGSFVVKIQN